MITFQEYLQRYLDKGKSIAWYAKGYYLSKGGANSFDLKVPVFEFENNIEKLKPTDVTKVLVDYLGSMMWINVLVNDLFYGTVPVKYNHEAKLIRFQLESLMK